jgi:hypothetical protein
LTHQRLQISVREPILVHQIQTLSQLKGDLPRFGFRQRFGHILLEVSVLKKLHSDEDARVVFKPA